MNEFSSISFQSAAAIKSYQNERLKDLIAYLALNSPYYKKLFGEHGINLTSIQSIEDLVKIPTTEKEDLQQFNSDFLCVSRNKIIEYTATSGTVSSPVTIALTENDLKRLAYNEYCSFVCAHGSPLDVYQLMLTLDRQFMAGMAYYSGIRKLGAGVVRVGPGVPSLQWEVIERIKPTAIVAVPSFIVKLIQYAHEQQIDINQSSVKKAVCIGENIRNDDLSLNVLGKKISDSWDIQLFSTYASTEMQTAFTECIAGNGGHLNPELLIVEILDEAGNPVPEGTGGEVTITTLGIEGMPLLRYKTGDICKIYSAACSCGRNTVRLSPVLGRKKQMIKFKGTTLFAPALFEIIHKIESIKEYVVEVCTNNIATDEVKLFLHIVEDSSENKNKIRSYIQAKLRVMPHISFVTQEEIAKIQFPEGVRKPVKFIDKRVPQN